jgi:hypothetical protein
MSLPGRKPVRPEHQAGKQQHTGNNQKALSKVFLNHGPNSLCDEIEQDSFYDCRFAHR